MTQRDVLFRQCLGDFDRAHRTDDTVVVAAFWNRVDVGADQQRGQGRNTAGSASDEIAGGIDRYIEVRPLHQTEDVFAALFVSVAISNTTDASLRIRAELREPAYVLHDALALNAQRLNIAAKLLLVKRETGKLQPAEAERQAVVEVATINLHWFP